MINLYMLLLEQHDGSMMIACASDRQAIVSTEENIYLLNEMGDRLLDHDLVAGYQIVVTAGLPVRKATGE